MPDFAWLHSLVRRGYCATLAPSINGLFFSRHEMKLVVAKQKFCIYLFTNEQSTISHRRLQSNQ